MSAERQVFSDLHEMAGTFFLQQGILLVLNIINIRNEQKMPQKFKQNKAKTETVKTSSQRNTKIVRVPTSRCNVPAF